MRGSGVKSERFWIRVGTWYGEAMRFWGSAGSNTWYGEAMRFWRIADRLYGAAMRFWKTIGAFYGSDLG